MPPPAILRPFLPRQPLTRDDWWMILLLWITGVALGWAQGEASALLPYTRRDLGVTGGEMSLVLALARLGAFGAILVGAAADRIGRRRPLIGALTLLLLANGISALADTAPFYGVAQSLARVGGASVAALAVVAMAEGVSLPVRAYAVGFFGAATSLGAGVSTMTLPLTQATDLGWRLPHALPLILLAAVPFLWRRLPESPLTSTAVPLPRRTLLQGDRGRRFLLVAMAGLLSSAFSAVGLAFTTERLIGDLGYPPASVILITVGGGTVGALGFLVGGRLADGWGRRPTSILALLLALAGGLILYRVESPGALFGAVVLSAFGTFAYIPSGGAHRAELFPTSLRAAAGTAVNYLAVVGSALGLVVGGVTIDAFGLFPTMALLGGGVLVAAVLTAALPETRGSDLRET